MEFSVANWCEICVEMEAFETDFFDRFSCEPSQLTVDKLKSTRSWDSIIGNWIVRFADMYHRSKALTVSAASKIEELNGQLIQNQQKVIVLQEQVMKSNDEQLVSVQSTVRDEMASIQTAVKSEFSSWSKVAERNKTNVPTFTQAKLKEAVRSAVVEEDRSRNFVIFNKEEVEEEDVARTVSDVLDDMSEKPRIIECRRVGKPQHGKPRPIKVKLTSCDAVSHILWRAKALKSSDRNKSTFIGPDRTVEEREVHRALVVQLKAKMEKEPDLYHFIKGGQIVNVKRLKVLPS
jgi:hypothetical protein